MAQRLAWAVLALLISLFAAYLATGVRQDLLFLIEALIFSTETLVRWHLHLLVKMVAVWARPGIVLFLRGLRLV